MHHNALIKRKNENKYLELILGKEDLSVCVWPLWRPNATPFNCNAELGLSIYTNISGRVTEQ